MGEGSAAKVGPLEGMQEQLPGDAAVERTRMYLQGELRSKRGCPGVQRVPQAYVG